MIRDQFTFYRSFWEAMKALPKKDQLSFVMAVCAYAFDEEPAKPSGAAAASFLLVKPILDKASKRAAAGRAGGSKPQANSKQSPSKSEAKPKETASKSEANGKQTPREKEGEKEVEVEVEVEREKEKEKEIENECSPPIPPSGGRVARFAVPTVAEVRAYCLERNNAIDPQAFVDFYAMKGWRVGKEPMKDWKAAVRTWENRRKEETLGSNHSAHAGGNAPAPGKWNLPSALDDA